MAGAEAEETITDRERPEATEASPPAGAEAEAPLSMQPAGTEAPAGTGASSSYGWDDHGARTS
jgi:hypothetical protein